MSRSLSEQLIQALQTTLIEVEASSGVSPDDPALLALKQIVLRRIADIELARADDSEASESVAGNLPSAAKLPPEVA